MNPIRNAPASTVATVLLTAMVGIGVFSAQPTVVDAPARQAVASVSTDATYLPAQFAEQQRVAVEAPLPAQF